MPLNPTSFVENKHVVIDQDDWRRIQPLIYDENGKYQPEVAVVETHWNGPFSIWLYMPEAQPLPDLLKSEEIPFSTPS